MMFRSQRGSVLLSGLMLVSVMTLLGLALFDLGVLENRLVLADSQDTRAFYMADAGLQASYLELDNGDGTMDFPTVFAGKNAVTLFTNVLLNPSGLSTGGGYTVTATPVIGSVPNQIRLSSTGCIPAANPCQADSPQSTVLATVVRKPRYYPIVGTQAVRIASGAALVDSYDSTRGCGSPPCSYMTAIKGSRGNILSNGTIDVMGTIKGDITGSADTASNPDLTIGSSTLVTGNVKSGGTVQNSGTVSGTITQNETSRTLTQEPVPNCGPPFTTSAVLTTALTPTSAYSYNQATGELNIMNTATLAAGSNYCVGDMTITGALRIEPGSAGVTVMIDGRWKVQGAGQINNLTQDASKLFLISSYGNDAGEDQTGVTLTGHSDVYIAVIAPHTEVVVSGGGEVYGVLMAARLTAVGGAGLHVDEAYENWTPVKGGVVRYGPLAGSWRQCPNRVQSC